ncbi:A-kinase anchor protein 1, mitochondrial-like isoform X2 [Ostrea edulis]|uniref:A-kinase anchor protein 1, mitochondrial-like isoform X2 n=1 Tax=Ostrea edulis TaxID=37623 RepID=UPI0024AFB842|nr:A-kinase anchor protein 1, mitochondrial-like isoform X2 [Ostrea edulis]
MPNFRGILTFALPAVTVVFGFIWYFGRKKTPKPKLLPKEETTTELTEKSSVTVPSGAELLQKTKEVEYLNDSSVNKKEKDVVEKANDKICVTESPVGRRKRKAFQITRTDDTEVSDGPDSVDEEMNKDDQCLPELSQSVSSSEPTPSQNDISVKWQGKTKKMEPSQNGSGEVTESELIAVNESIVCESASQSLLYGEKTSLMNDAFMTSGISEQSILGEKDKLCKVEDISLSTSLTEPLLESTVLDTTQSQPQTEVVEDLVDKKKSSVTEKVPLVNMNDSMSSKSPSPLSSVSENVTKQSKDSASPRINASVQKSAADTKKTEINSHTADKTDTDKHNTNNKKSTTESDTHDKDNKKSTSPKPTNGKTASPAKQESHQSELSRKGREDAHHKVSSPKDRLLNRQTHPSGGSDHALDNGIHGSDSNSSGCDNASEASNDSGRGPSMTDLPTPNTSPNQQLYHCNFPTAICGRLIGKQGKNINFIKEKTGANITLSANPFTPEFQLCSIEGTQRQIEAAVRQIGRKFPDVDLSPVNIPSSDTPQSAVLMPDIMQLNLPEGVSVDVVVSSIVDAGHIFIQQPTHPSFPSLERLNQFMIACYMQDGLVPQLPRPLEVGVICAAPMLNGWYRAQISAVGEESDECDIKYVDYGGFSRVQGNTLRQIRSDFMTLPFQACECYMANITPLQDEDYFSAEAAAILEELTQGKMLQAQVVGRSEEGIPYVHIYQINGEKVTFVNRELVNRGVTRWIEVLS